MLCLKAKRMLNLSSVLRAFLLTHLIKFLLFIYIPYLKCYIYLNLQTIIDYSVVFILINHSSLYFLEGDTLVVILPLYTTSLYLILFKNLRYVWSANFQL